MTINQITEKFTTTKLLREMSFGNWENKKFLVLKKKFPELTKKYVQGSEKFKAPQGESFQNMLDRSIRFISKLNDDDNQGDYLIVTHGGLLRTLIVSFLNMPMKNIVNFHFDNCSITEIAYKISNNSLLTKLNDTQHLK
jgi:broad specificity phosphatase PhoE